MTRPKAPEPDDLDFGAPGEDPPVPGPPDVSSDAPDFGEPGADPIVAPVSDDGATTDLAAFDDDTSADDRVVLDWACEAALIEHALRLPAILDPTRPGSTWYTDRSEGGGPITVAVLAVRARVDLRVEYAADERLVLGRDFLGGRVLVRS